MYRRGSRSKLLPVPTQFRRKINRKHIHPSKALKKTKPRAVLLRLSRRKKEEGYFTGPIAVIILSVSVTAPFYTPIPLRIMVFIAGTFYAVMSVSNIVSGIYFARCHDNHPDLSNYFDQIGVPKWFLDNTWKRLWNVGRNNPLYYRGILCEYLHYLCAVILVIVVIIMAIMVIHILESP